MSVSDLTGTTWIFNDEVWAPTVSLICSINFTSNNTSFTQISSYYWYGGITRGGDTPEPPVPPVMGENYLNYVGYDSALPACTGSVSYPQQPCNSWLSDAYKTIEITGGTDVTNATLISFLESNATQQSSSTIDETQTYTIYGRTLQAICDAVKNKTGASSVNVYDLPTEISNIETGTDTSDATLNSASQMLSGVTAYSKGTKYTGNIATKTSSDLSASGATVTVPAGYYATQASKAVSSGSATTPATTISSSPTISINASGLITASNSKTQSVTPTVSAGYVSSGTAGTITVTGSNTSQMTTKGATTYTPTTSNQTISSGTYLTGTQTISGDANLVAGNIKKDVSIFGVTGTYEGSGGGMVVVETQDSHGGTIVEITGDQISLQSKTGYQQKNQTILTPDTGYSGLSQVTLPAWYPNGPQPELVTTMATTTYNLSTDTTWDSWTKSTTAASIKASSTLGTFKANSMASYDYLIEWTTQVSFAFTSGASLVSLPYKTFVRMYQHITRRPSNLTNLNANNFNGNVCITGISVPMILYYASDGTQTLGWSGSYTVYPSITAATFSSSTAASPTVTVKLPAVYARCSNTYLPVANAGYIDSTKTTITIGCKVYRTVGTGIERATYQLGVNDYLNTLS